MNHDVYNRNAEKHAERTSPDKLSPEFFEMFEKFTSYVSSGAILDVGCGVGRDLRLLADTEELDVTGVGVDMAENMVRQGRELTEPSESIIYCQATATELPFRNNSFSGVWSPATVFLLTFDQMKDAIQEMRRVSKEDAIVEIGFKLYDDQSDENGYHTRDRWGEEITYYYVDQDLAQSLCKDAGFQIVDTHSNMFNGTCFYNLFLLPE